MGLFIWWVFCPRYPTHSSTYTLVKFQELVKNGIKVTKYMLFFRIFYTLYINISTGLSQALSTSTGIVCVKHLQHGKICLKISPFDFCTKYLSKNIAIWFLPQRFTLQCPVGFSVLHKSTLHWRGRWNGESKGFKVKGEVMEISSLDEKVLLGTWKGVLSV